VTSQRKREANHINSQSSTGPKTREGKARSAQNARSHGLSTSVLIDPLLSATAEELAREIAGPRLSDEILELARRVAEAQVDLARVRQARHEILVSRLNDPDYSPRKTSFSDDDKADLLDRIDRLPKSPSLELLRAHIENKPKCAKKLASVLFELSTEYSVIDRYERRAISRRKFAVRALDEARAKSGLSNR